MTNARKDDDVVCDHDDELLFCFAVVVAAAVDIAAMVRLSLS